MPARPNGDLSPEEARLAILALVGELRGPWAHTRRAVLAGTVSVLIFSNGTDVPIYVEVRSLTVGATESLVFGPNGDIDTSPNSTGRQYVLPEGGKVGFILYPGDKLFGARTAAGTTALGIAEVSL